jgi:hypothetical protein
MFRFDNCYRQAVHTHFVATCSPEISGPFHAVSAADFILNLDTFIRNVLTLQRIFSPNTLYHFFGELFRLPSDDNLAFAVITTMQYALQDDQGLVTPPFLEMEGLTSVCMPVYAPRQSHSVQRQDILFTLAAVLGLSRDRREEKNAHGQTTVDRLKFDLTRLHRQIQIL